MLREENGQYFFALFVPFMQETAALFLLLRKPGMKRAEICISPDFT